VRRALRGIGLEYEIAARELIANLVEILAGKLKAKAESMFAFDPREIVNRLQGIVGNDVRAIGAIANGAKIISS
jgi:hypothetical protein